MFTNHPNPAIVQIRRELRGKLPDAWIEEIVSIVEFQLSYRTIDELSTEDLLRLKLASMFSPKLKEGLDQSVGQPRQHSESITVRPQNGGLFGMRW